MADVLGWDYYDREIIDRIAQEQGLDSEYVQTVLEKHEWRSVPMLYISVSGHPVVMCHYPMLTWPGVGRGRYMVYGHIHKQCEYGLLAAACQQGSDYLPNMRR